MDAPSEDITGLLRAWQHGNNEAENRLVRVLYDYLKKISHRHLKRNPFRDLTLETTELVHEAYLRLVGQKETDWRDRAHFFGMAATLMRRILVDYLRSKMAAKRGGGLADLTFNPTLHSPGQNPIGLLDLDEALCAFEKVDRRKCRVVEMRFFGGMSIDETAAALKVSSATVKLDWRLAKAWLFQYLSKGKG